MSWRVVDGPAVRGMASAAENGRRLTPLRSRRTSTALALVGMHCVGCALALGLLACATELPSGDTTLADGRSFTQLVANSDSVVVLLLDPEECLGCNPNFAAWMEWARNYPTRLALVLSRVPTPDEVRRLAALHVVPSGVLARTWRHAIRSPHTPAEMLFVRGRLVVSARAELRGPMTILQRQITDAQISDSR